MLEHVRDDAVGDLRRLERDAELLVDVPRPLERAHAEHRLRRAVGPVEAVLGDERPAPAVPGGLRVEQEAVEVEDDGADQAGDQGIEPQPAVLETAILNRWTSPPGVAAGAIVARSVRAPMRTYVRAIRRPVIRWSLQRTARRSYPATDAWKPLRGSANTHSRSHSTAVYPAIIDRRVEPAMQLAAPATSQRHGSAPLDARVRDRQVVTAIALARCVPAAPAPGRKHERPIVLSRLAARDRATRIRSRSPRPDPLGRLPLRQPVHDQAAERPRRASTSIRATSSRTCPPTSAALFCRVLRAARRALDPDPTTATLGLAPEAASAILDAFIGPKA